MKYFNYIITSILLTFSPLYTETIHEDKIFMNTYDLNLAFSLLQPETDLEQKIIASVDWIEGAKWGEPRPGHPEGAIIWHILEVLNNVDNFYGNSPLREQLRLIAIIHDTFKYKVDFQKLKIGENQHQVIARQFAQQFIDDTSLLDIIQLHDDAYHAWNVGKKSGDWAKAQQLADELIVLLGPHLELYLAFFECDNTTGNKTPEPFLWFKNIAINSLNKS